MSWNLYDLDKNIFVFLNRDHSTKLDIIMFSARNLLLWVPLALLCMFMLFDYRRNRTTTPHSMIKTLMLCSLILVQLILCEYVLPYFFDPIAIRERPVYNSDISSLVNLDNFSFLTRAVIFSSQACAAAAISIFLIIYYNFSFKWLKVLLVFWILLISYNRIYIGAQYPSTILASIALGASIGLLASEYYQYLKNHILAI